MTEEELSEKYDAKYKQKEKKAAHLLMKQYIEHSSNEFAEALCRIVPLFEEISEEGLKIYMNTVNATIATIAIDVVRDLYNMDFDDPDRRHLPCHPDDMQSAVEYLTKLVSCIGYLGKLLSQFDEPAIRESRLAYSRDY